jgi:hypothetical protein
MRRRIVTLVRGLAVGGPDVAAHSVVHAEMDRLRLHVPRRLNHSRADGDG